MELSKYPYIQAGVLIHPSLVSLEDIQGEIHLVKMFSIGGFELLFHIGVFLQ